MPTDFIKDVAAALKPPEDGAPTPEYRWRTTVAYSIVCGYGLAMLQAAAMWGFLNTFGFMGFAQAADVNARFKTAEASIAEMKTAMRADTNDLKATIIAGQIIGMHATECSARRANNTPLAESISAQISDLQVSYMRVSAGLQYPLQSCP